MKRSIRVFLGDGPGPIGTIRHDAHGARESAAFEYDPGWLAAPDLFAVDPTLPLVVGAQFHRRVQGGSVFHSAIADTEPDGWGRRVILRDHAKRRQLARRPGLARERSAAASNRSSHVPRTSAFPASAQAK